MKIIMLSSDFLPNIGGIAAHIYHISKALQKLGNEVVILNPIISDHNKIEVENVDGLWCYRSYYDNKHSSRIKRLFNRTSSLLSTYNKIVEDRGPFDILHQHDYMNNEVAANLLSFKINWIWTNHSSGFLLDYNASKNRILSKLLYSRIKGCITVSHEIFEKTKELLANKNITYIPNGVDTDKFHPDVEVDRLKYGIDENDFVVLCPRRIVKKNGVLYFAQAIKQIINDRHQNIKFLILGNEVIDEINEEYLYETLEIVKPYVELGYVKLLGNLPMGLMPEVNSLSDVVVMPSLMEAVSLSALEGMATRKAIISTNVGGLPEIIHHMETGILVNPQNADEIAKEIIKLKEDKQLRQKLAKGAYCFSTENYSWIKIAKQTQNYYEKVIGER